MRHMTGTLRATMEHFLYFHRQKALLAHASPAACLRLLTDAARPSRDRLHLQDLFISGRRYQVQQSEGGFEVLTTSNHYWRYTEGMWRLRQRTRPVTRLVGQMEPVGEAYTRITLTTRIRRMYLLDVIWIPLFVTTIVLPMPWAWWLRLTIVLVLFALSYVYHYYNAANQANALTFFVDKALQDKLVVGLPGLAANTQDVVHMNADFEQAWTRFYERTNQEAD